MTKMNCPVCGTPHTVCDEDLRNPDAALCTPCWEVECGRADQPEDIFDDEREFARFDDMDGDHESALASAGWGTDEDYGDYGQYDDYSDCVDSWDF